MKDDKFILEVHKAALITNSIVRITDEAAEVVKQVQRETGLSATQIISKMILFAAERLEVKEV